MAEDLWGDLSKLMTKWGPLDVLIEQSRALLDKSGGRIELRIAQKLNCWEVSIGFPGSNHSVNEPFLSVYGDEFPVLVASDTDDIWANTEAEFCDLLRNLFRSDSVREQIADTLASADSIARTKKAGS